MLRIYYLKFLSLIVLLSPPYFLEAQEEVPFQVSKKFYEKGNSILIGNTILGKHKSKPFDSPRASNDIVNMTYVDVDTNNLTFSSSSARLQVPDTQQEIIYAGLYWSALYPAEKSVMKKGARRMVYKNKGERIQGVDSVLIKIAGQPYTPIKGTIIFNADNKGPFKTDAPYACKADITEYLNALDTVDGMFTVANMKAVQGKLEGGSAGGWLLYVVYKDPTQSAKYFTTYDGFKQINKKGVDIVFDDFQTKHSGAITSTLLMAALEGDIKIKSDECAIYNKSTDTFEILKNEQREANNFFNSSIAARVERIPPSKNTLGFDLAITELPEGIITNSAKETSIKFSTKTDRFYLFFTAFETEIEVDYLANKVPSNGIEKISDEIAVAQPNIKEIANNTQKTTSDSIPIILNKAPKTIPIAGMASGYYLVTNVFSQADLAEKWTQKLIKEGYNPQSFINPENNWTYVYVERSNILKTIWDHKETIRNKEGFEKSWVAAINR